MAKYYGFCIIAVLSVFLLASCSQESITTETGKFAISAISPENPYIGSEISIFGNEFGSPGDSSFVLFDTTLAIRSADCIKWNNSLIKLKLPKNSYSCNIRIIKGRDTSNAIYIKIEKLPPLDLAAIQPGSFLMGSDAGMINEKPPHQVTITKGFFISKTEITNELWNAVMPSNPAIFTDLSLPVSNITWNEAVYFCNNLSKIMGFDTCYIIKGDTIEWNNLANGFRLPTEAEWEYASRAGSSDDISGSSNPDEVAWHSNNSGIKPHPVAQKKPNAWGLYDMHGNVWEWCWDRYGADYYASSPSTDPAGPESGSARVLRGGSWRDGLLFLRSPNRTFPGNALESAGLRVVRTM